jgi:phage/plasmid-associated DNA primase
LDDIVQQNLNLKYKKEFISTFSNAKISTYALQLIDKFKKDDIIMDVTLNEIHFNNGYMDLLDLVFKQRDLTKHFVTQYIKRDYEPSTAPNRNIMMKEVRKIIPNKEDLDAVLMVFGSALTGDSCKEQTTMFILGNGNAGKSLFMSLA